MIRFFIVISLALSSAFSANAQAMRPINQVSIVALIITSGEETPVALGVTHTLEALDAQVLTANAPNASQMRSILKRFAAAAIDIDVALVYYDGAVLKIGDREFVAPGGITLRRPSDLLTKAIPLSSLARATALAGNGGAVLVHSTGQGVDLIDGVSLANAAPTPHTGTSPILFASSTAALNVADTLEAMVQTTGDISLSDALSGLAGLDGVSISQLPIGHAMLRTTLAPAPPAASPDTTMANTALDGANTTPSTKSVVASLPQVGVPDTPLSEATDSADPATMAPGMDEQVSGAAEIATTTSSTELAPPPDLSIDVLRAIQGDLSRAQKRKLQHSLRSLHFYRGLIDGIFGPQTERAISAYQESIGADVTGVLTPGQLEALSK